MKLLTIIIPMFNVAQYLNRCLGSVFAQNLNTNTFEVILVDDESPDNSVEVAKRLTKNQDNVKIISQKNKGLGGARNTGINNATGKYILFLDADDFYKKNSLEKLISKTEKYNLDILEFGAEAVDENNKTVFVQKKSNEPLVLSGVDYCNNLKYMPSACNKLYKRDFLLTNKLNFVQHIYGEDFEFNARAFFIAQKVMATDYVAVNFYQSNDSITRSTSSTTITKYIYDLVHILIQLKQFKEENFNNQPKKEERYFKDIMSYTVIAIFYKILYSDFKFKEVNGIKEKLHKQGLFIINHKVEDPKKELFRRYLLSNKLWLYKIVFNFKKVF